MNHDALYRELESQYFGDEMHEREEIELLPSLLRGARIFADVGASLGQYAFFAGETMLNGRIVCIEADPLRYTRLCKLASEWQENSSNRYDVIHAAAADTPGQTEFFVTGRNLSGALFQHTADSCSDADEIAWKSIKVDAVTLDDVFADGDPDLVKIDVEGAEYRVLLGAQGLLSRGKTRFLVEVHPWGDRQTLKTPRDLFELFGSFGYDAQRTHRHWHFEKRGSPLTRWIKRKAFIFVLESPRLKRLAKKLVHG